MPDPAASTPRVLWDGDHAMLRDLGSTNGTKLNGQRIREAQLSSDMVITIGRTDLDRSRCPGLAGSADHRA